LQERYQITSQKQAAKKIKARGSKQDRNIQLQANDRKELTVVKDLSQQDTENIQTKNLTLMASSKKS
jgi:hypothetical protein